MSESQLTIICDTREQNPLPLTRFPVVTGTLDAGDYSVKGLVRDFAVERKSIDDLVQSVTRERDRFFRECQRLRGYRFRRLLIEGHKVEVTTGRFRSGANPKSILHSVAAIEARFDLPVVWAGSRQGAADQLEQWTFWFWREFHQIGEMIGRTTK